MKTIATIIITLLCLSIDSPAQSNLLQTGISGFFVTNVPTSHAICLLAKQSPVLINAVIDDTNDPPVTISAGRSTIGEILHELLVSHPAHAPHEGGDGAILILPDRFWQHQIEPFTKRLVKFDATYRLWKTRNGNLYGVDFYPPLGSLNIQLSPTEISQPPNYASFPHVRTFTNQSIVAILTTIAKEGAGPFYCYREGPALVQEVNKETARQKKTTWWPNPDAPCYSLIWGTKWYGKRP